LARKRSNRRLPSATLPRMGAGHNWHTITRASPTQHQSLGEGMGCAGSCEVGQVAAPVRKPLAGHRHGAPHPNLSAFCQASGWGTPSGAGQARPDGNTTPATCTDRPVEPANSWGPVWPGSMPRRSCPYRALKNAMGHSGGHSHWPGLWQKQGLALAADRGSSAARCRQTTSVTSGFAEVAQHPAGGLRSPPGSSSTPVPERRATPRLLAPPARGRLGHRQGTRGLASALTNPIQLGSLGPAGP